MNISQVGKSMIGLCAAALTGERCEAAVPIDKRSLYALSAAHDVAHLVSYALYRQKQLNISEHPDADFYKAQMLAVYRYEQLRAASAQLYAAFEQQMIEFLPLKGADLRALYPEGWMRTSCDIDVLVHREDMDRTMLYLTEQMHYEKSGATAHDVSLTSPEGVHIELHYTLMEDIYSSAWGSVLERVWEYARPVDGAVYRKQMCDEMFYFYHMAHMAKHFEVGGCGVRPVMDTWFLNRRADADAAAREQLLREGGLWRFAEKVTELSEMWLSGKEGNEVCAAMEEYILRGGVYGTVKNGVVVHTAKRGGSKLRYMLERVFMPYDRMCLRYRVLKRHAYLLPILWVHRWFDILFSGRWRHGRAATEMRLLLLHTEGENVRSVEQMMQELELS